MGDAYGDSELLSSYTLSVNAVMESEFIRFYSVVFIDFGPLRLFLGSISILS